MPSNVSLPPVVYRVDLQHDVYKTQSTKSKVAKAASVIFTILFVVPVGLIRLIGLALNYYFATRHLLPSLRLDKKELDKAREEFLAQPGNADRSRRMYIQRADGKKIDSFEMSSSNQKHVLPQDQKWVVYFNGNSMAYEKNLNNLREFSDQLNANVLAFNYSGVGHSQGRTSSVRDAALDGEAMMQYLLSNGVERKNILIYGWSWGGAVGAEVAINHQIELKENNVAVHHDYVNFCSDRSFSTLKKLVHILPLYNSRSRFIAKIHGALNYFFVKTLGWDFDSVKNYDKIKGYKWIIYTKQDLKIPHKASLYKSVKKEQNKKLMLDWEHRKKRVSVWKPERIKIQGLVGTSAHSTGINSIPEFASFKDHVQQAFRRV